MSEQKKLIRPGIKPGKTTIHWVINLHPICELQGIDLNNNFGGTARLISSEVTCVKCKAKIKKFCVDKYIIAKSGNAVNEPATEIVR